MNPNYVVSETPPEPEPGFTWVPVDILWAGLNDSQIVVVLRFLQLTQRDPLAGPSDLNLYHVTRKKRSDSSSRAIRGAIEALSGVDDELAAQMSEWIAG